MWCRLPWSSAWRWRSPWLPALLLACGLGMAAQPAESATYCVGSAGTLQSAIASANADPEGTVEDIRVRPGTYTLPGFTFNPAGDRDSKDFSLTGGWNADCTVRTVNAASTIINAPNSDIRLLGDQLRIVVDGLSFRQFRTFEIDEPACGFAQICSGTEAVRVRNNEFRNGGRIELQMRDATQFSFSGNLVADLSGDNDNPTVLFTYLTGGAGANISFNTFANLGCGAGALPLFLSSDAPGTQFHHNIVQSSCTPNLFVCDVCGEEFALRNNVYGSRGGEMPSVLSGNLITTNPGFILPAGGDYRLRESSPVSAAINAGLTQTGLAQAGLSAPAQDLDGPSGGRLVGLNYDPGAYESAVNNASIITVTSTADSGAGTLRQAIASANAAPGPQTIRFNLAGSCPRLIVLDSELPDITDELIIDGYSQPGSSANTMETGSDAAVCVVLLPQPDLDQALQVPSAATAATSLTVRGLAFAGSTGFNGNFSVAVRLRAGSDHVIAGNLFGGTGTGSTGTLGLLNAGVQVRGTALDAVIGGDEPGDRNIFGNIAVTAVQLLDATSGGHRVQNNYIGLSPSGNVAAGIGLNGVFASGSPGGIVRENLFASTDTALVITGATATGYAIERNKFGVSAFNIPGASFRNNTAIRIDGGSGGHRIGDVLSNTPSNLVTNSRGPGIWINSGAGGGTLIRPNQVFGNGIDGTGLGIDIGALGRLPNDNGDGDGGPNSGQNFPLITASTPNGDGTRQVSATLASTPNTAMRIDIYRSPDCPGGNRGGNLANRIGTVTTTTNAQGNASFSFALPGTGAPGFLTATATNLVTFDTSEIGECFQEADALFANGFE